MSETGTPDDDRHIAPMRVQLKMDDGTESGCWVTVFEGWTELEASARAADESAVLARAVVERTEGSGE